MKVEVLFLKDNFIREKIENVVSISDSKNDFIIALKESNYEGYVAQTFDKNQYLLKVL